MKAQRAGERYVALNLAGTTSANALYTGRAENGGTLEPYTLDGGVLKDKNGDNATLTVGTDIELGDLIMIDWDGDGSVTHTTILYSGGSYNQFLCSGVMKKGGVHWV